MSEWNIEIFVERPDAKIIPIPGVYSSSTSFNKKGISSQVHDCFLRLPDTIINLYFESLDYQKQQLIVVFIGGFLYDNLNMNEIQWFTAINYKLSQLKKERKSYTFAVVGFFSNVETMAMYFSSADIVLNNGYDSLTSLPNRVSNRKINILEGFRKPVKYISANGYLWRSVYLMIDMPSMACPIGSCPNCSVIPSECIAIEKAKKVNFRKNFTELRWEIEKNKYPINISLIGNSLNINEEKLSWTIETFYSLKQQSELHLDINIFQFMILSNSLIFFNQLNIGSLRITVPALNSKGLLLYGFSKFDICKNIELIRSLVGRNTFIIVNIIIGLPGDSVSNIQSKIDIIQSVVDVVTVQVIEIHNTSNLLKLNYYKTTKEKIDIWGNCEWIMSNLTREEAIKWSLNYDLSKAKDPSYRNYKFISDTLFSSNTEFSSNKIRKLLKEADTKKDSAEWLYNYKLSEDNIQIMNYIELYNEVISSK